MKWRNDAKKSITTILKSSHKRTRVTFDFRYAARELESRLPFYSRSANAAFIQVVVQLTLN